MKTIVLLTGILFSIAGLKAQVTCYGSGTDSITYVVSHTDPFCSGSCDGTAVVSVLAGSGSYTYSWTGPGISVPLNTSLLTNMCAGVYTLVVTDVTFGISCTSIVTLVDPPQVTGILVSSVQPTNSNCNGALTYSVAGGNGPYTYQLLDCVTMSPAAPLQSSSAFSGLCAGTYAVEIVDANGCMTITSCYTLCEIQVLESITPITCAGMCDASIVLTTTAPNPTYAWNTGATGSTLTGLCDGVYCVTVTDGVTGCQFDTCYVIDPQFLLTPTIVSTTDVTCYGDCDGSAVMNSTGGTGATQYSLDMGASWYPFPTFDSLCPGIYQGYAQDSNGCQGGPITFIINEPDELILFVDSVQDASGPGVADGAIYFSTQGGIPPYTYQILPVVNPAVLYVDILPGTYQICVTDANRCVNCTNVTVGVTLGIDSDNLEKTILFPNPSAGYFNLQLPESVNGELKISVIDLMSRTVYSQVQPAKTSVDIQLPAGVSPGHYFVQLEHKGIRKTFRLTVR